MTEPPTMAGGSGECGGDQSQSIRFCGFEGGFFCEVLETFVSDDDEEEAAVAAGAIPITEKVATATAATKRLTNTVYLFA